MDQNDLSMEKIMQLAQSAAGQKMLRWLKTQDSAALDRAARSAAAGNMDAAKQALRQVLSSPEGQRLLRELEE